MRLEVRPAAGPLRGDYRPPGDKSVSHRAAILGGLAEGTSRIEGFLDSADTRATLAAMERLGASVEFGDDAIEITGGRLAAPDGPLDLGNSGTGMRLLCGALAGRPDLSGAEIRLTGDASLSARPMARIIEPLARMGAVIESDNDYAPLILRPARLSGIEYALPVASAQVKSALLLAGLAASGRTRVIEPGLARDHTERMLPAFGVAVAVGESDVSVAGGQRLRAAHCRVPGDISSAAFPIAAVLLVSGSSLRLTSVGLNPTRDGFLRLVEAMGGRLETARVESTGGEPQGDLSVHASRLRGIDIPPEAVPAAIDELPLLMALAAAAAGQTRIAGAAELRLKESDRLAVMCRALSRLGVKVSERPDGAVIVGGDIAGGTADCAGDHRIAMSLAVLGLIARAPVVIDNAEWIETSYPGFVEDMRGLGADLAWQ